MTAAPETEGEAGPPLPPSKSARKRAAHAVQDLGAALLELNAAQLSALALPEALAGALAEARRITSRAARARQLQYIGKLMRSVDPEPIRAALAAADAEAAREGERHKRISAWRERLLLEGDAALDELARWHPDIDRSAWVQRIGAARAERTRGGAGAAGRELFRALRALFATMPE
jgi:ribosome-associated protein